MVELAGIPQVEGLSQSSWALQSFGFRLPVTETPEMDPSVDTPKMNVCPFATVPSTTAVTLKGGSMVNVLWTAKYSQAPLIPAISIPSEEKVGFKFIFMQPDPTSSWPKVIPVGPLTSHSVSLRAVSLVKLSVFSKLSWADVVVVDCVCPGDGMNISK